MATTEPRRPIEVAHDEAPSKIDDHAFEPRGAWYTLCKHCTLAMAAHDRTTVDAAEEIRKDHLRQQEWREAEQQRLHSGGRARIAYVGDEDDE